VRRRKHVADLNLHAFGEDLADFGQTVLVDVLRKDGGDRLGHHRVQHLPLAHLVRAHQIELQLAERRGVQVPQIADPRYGGRFAEHGGAMPCGSNHRAVIREG
jgi:hypothetical protein